MPVPERKSVIRKEVKGAPPAWAKDKIVLRRKSLDAYEAAKKQARANDKAWRVEQREREMEKAGGDAE